MAKILIASNLDFLMRAMEVLKGGHKKMKRHLLVEILAMIITTLVYIAGCHPPFPR